MSIISNILLSFSLSADAFAVSISNGIAMRKPHFITALKMALIFGIVESITPLIGWGIGTLSADFLSSVDHWLALIILGGIGGKMIREGLEQESHNDNNQSSIKKQSLMRTIMVAIGTSIDSMAVGTTLAFIKVDIIMTAIMIGTATFIMSLVGIMAGSYIGKKAGKAAEICAGLCLIIIGILIFLEVFL